MSSKNQQTDEKTVDDEVQDPIISHEKDFQAIERTTCAISPGYFIDNYLQIDDPNQPGSDWFPFKLWPAQRIAVKEIINNKKLIILKARQLGITWLVLAYCLHMMIFKPGSVIMLFSKNGTDAKELIRRLSGMIERLPDWLRPELEKDLTKELHFTNLSRAMSFATTKASGRSFTASFVLIDEAAFIPFLQQLLNSAEATVDSGGQLAIVSTNDKEKPNNGFATLYRRTLEGRSEFKEHFIPWYGRPGRDAEWYEGKVINKIQDDLWQEYPETPEQALAGKTTSKRFSQKWVENCTLDDDSLTHYGRAGLPKINGVVYYRQPQEGRDYLVTCDTAEGDPGSDPTAFAVWDALLYEEVAFGMGQWQPGVTAGYLWRLAQAYNNAIICVERNNHGHAVNLSLRESWEYPLIYRNPFDGKDGWYSSARTKTIAMDKLGDLMDDGEIGMRSKVMLMQIGNIDANTMEAPEGDHDDAALVAVIAAAALTWKSTRSKQAARPRIPSMTL